MKLTLTKRLWVAVLTAMAMLVTLAGPGWAATTYTVTKDGAGADENIQPITVNGTDYTTLSDLVNNLASGEDNTVNVGAGTYYLAKTLDLNAGVKLIGAGAGTIRAR